MMAPESIAEIVKNTVSQIEKQLKGLKDYHSNKNPDANVPENIEKTLKAAKDCLKKVDAILAKSLDNDKAVKLK